MANKAAHIRGGTCHITIQSTALQHRRKGISLWVTKSSTMCSLMAKTAAFRQSEVGVNTFKGNAK